jgi:hypothetical protein
MVFMQFRILYSIKQKQDKCFTLNLVLNLIQFLAFFFLKIQATFYKHALNLKNWCNMRYNYLSIELLLNVLAIFFEEKKKYNFFFQI